MTQRELRRLEIDELLVNNSGDAMSGTEQSLDVGMLLGFLDHADKGLIDYCGGSTALTNDCIA